MDDKPPSSYMDNAGELTDREKSMIRKSAAAQFFILSSGLDSMLKRSRRDSEEFCRYERGKVCAATTLGPVVSGVGPMASLPTPLTSLGLSKLMKIADQKWTGRKDSLTLSMLSSLFEDRHTKNALVDARDFGRCVMVMEGISKWWDVEHTPEDLDIYGGKVWFHDNPYFIEVSGIGQCIDAGVSLDFLRKIYDNVVLENISHHLFGIVSRLNVGAPPLISDYNVERINNQPMLDNLKCFTKLCLDAGREYPGKLYDGLGLIGYLEKMGVGTPQVTHEEIKLLEHHLGGWVEGRELIGLGLSSLKRKALQDLVDDKVRPISPRPRLL